MNVRSQIAIPYSITSTAASSYYSMNIGYFVAVGCLALDLLFCCFGLYCKGKKRTREKQDWYLLLCLPCMYCPMLMDQHIYSRHSSCECGKNKENEMCKGERDVHATETTICTQEQTLN